MILIKINYFNKNKIICIVKILNFFFIIKIILIKIIFNKNILKIY